MRAAGRVLVEEESSGEVWMCRHVGYLGPPVSLGELLVEPAHSLLEQTWSPADMRGGGTVNVDGFGVGWYPDAASPPVRHRAAVPMWTDQLFASLAGSVVSGAVLAAVRSATVGMPVTDTACAPFTEGGWMFSHNGRVEGWPDSLAKVAAELEVVDLMTLDAPTDSAVLWALLRQRLNRGQDPAAAVCELVERVVAVAPASRLNLLLTDGARMVATTWTHALSLRVDGESVTLSSEPFGDSSEWEELPDRQLVTADVSQVRVTALDERKRP